MCYRASSSQLVTKVLKCNHGLAVVVVGQFPSQNVTRTDRNQGKMILSCRDSALGHIPLSMIQMLLKIEKSCNLGCTR